MGSGFKSRGVHWKPGYFSRESGFLHLCRCQEISSNHNEYQTHWARIGHSPVMPRPLQAFDAVFRHKPQFLLEEECHSECVNNYAVIKPEWIVKIKPYVCRSACFCWIQESTCNCSSVGPSTCGACSVEGLQGTP